MFADPLTDRIASFVRAIGIDVRAEQLADATFLPGVDIRYGALLLDEQRLAYPGDLLHEAGHIAVAPAEQRREPQLSPTQADEIATQAWSWAALRHLDLAPETVFHPHGYKGASEALIEAFATCSSPPGVPLLAWYGMTVETKNAAARGVEPFPHMQRWLR